jgi:N-acetylmuramoyl-L-alanine amidase-like
MKIPHIKTQIATLILLLSNFSHSDAIKNYDDKQYDEKINQIYRKLNNNDLNTLEKRIQFISKQFLNQPYVLGPLGEGKKGTIDQDPLYRTDQFDCTTYVSTVVALSLAHDLTQFKNMINKVRYKQGNVSFLTRNHFTSKDWNINNQRQGYVDDITTTIKAKDGKKIYKIAHAIIDKPNWYKHFSKKNIKLIDTSTKTQQNRLNKLKQDAKALPKSTASINYIPLNKLFNKNKQSDMFIFNQIPSGSIIEIVRPNWNLKDKIGTCLNVSHLGFGIRKKGILYFREASLTQKKIIDVPLDVYLRTFIDSPTIKGINIQIVKPQALN